MQYRELLTAGQSDKEIVYSRPLFVSLALALSLTGQGLVASENARIQPWAAHLFPARE